MDEFDKAFPGTEVTMLNSRGRVSAVKKWEVETLKTQGWRVILYPKQTYYPQYDQSLNPPKEGVLEERQSYLLYDEPTNMLECEQIT